LDKHHTAQTMHMIPSQLSAST